MRKLHLLLRQLLHFVVNVFHLIFDTWSWKMCSVRFLVSFSFFVCALCIYNVTHRHQFYDYYYGRAQCADQKTNIWNIWIYIFASEWGDGCIVVFETKHFRGQHSTWILAKKWWPKYLIFTFYPFRNAQCNTSPGQLKMLDTTFIRWFIHARQHSILHFNLVGIFLLFSLFRSLNW